MDRSNRAIVVEFANSISEEELRHLASRMNERKSGDLAEVINRLSKNRDMDDVLSSASSADEFFDYCDEIAIILSREAKKKGLLSSATVAA